MPASATAGQHYTKGVKHAAWIGVFALLIGGCSIYFGDDDDPAADAGPLAPDADGIPDASPATCDPIAQTGCASGEKCTSFADPMSPTMLKTQCTMAGTVAIGEACTKDPTTAIDDCVAGAWCDEGGTCSSICTETPDSCTAGFACLRNGEAFLDRSGVGICEPTCSVFAQNCPIGEGCYLILDTGTSVCARTTGAGLTQGQQCDFLEQCARGYGCVLSESPSNTSQNECAYFCNSSGGNPACANGPGANFECRQIRDFYSNATNVAEGIGMCVDPVEWPSP